ncbi:MAG TPA: cupredoxin domain-containing protein [Anaeromyxobacteraceae bacterium]|nr:cupredoxin domain-containing protein [Anaeromyxobacteraceae bacterium]
MSGRRAGAIAAALVGAAVLVAVAAPLVRRPGSLEEVRPGVAGPGPDGVQTLSVEVERGAYVPNLLHARAGQPLRLRIRVRDAHACSTRLLVPDLGLDLTLPERGEIEFLLPPAPAGAHVFTCGMKMVKGVLSLE